MTVVENQNIINPLDKNKQIDSQNLKSNIDSPENDSITKVLETGDSDFAVNLELLKSIISRSPQSIKLLPLWAKMKLFEIYGGALSRDNKKFLEEDLGLSKSPQAFEEAIRARSFDSFGGGTSAVMSAALGEARDTIGLISGEIENTEIPNSASDAKLERAQVVGLVVQQEQELKKAEEYNSNVAPRVAKEMINKNKSINVEES